jgi:hypothetical protein
MKFHVIYQCTSSSGQSPMRIVEQATGDEVGWINRFLDREYIRRLADTTLRIYAHELLHFLRWWESVHHTGDIAEKDLSESTCSSMCASNPANNHGHPPPRSTTAPPSSTAPCVTTSLTLPARLPEAFIKPSCGVGHWAWAGRAWR